MVESVGALSVAAMLRFVCCGFCEEPGSVPLTCSARYAFRHLPFVAPFFTASKWEPRYWCRRHHHELGIWKQWMDTLPVLELMTQVRPGVYICLHACFDMFACVRVWLLARKKSSYFV